MINFNQSNIDDLVFQNNDIKKQLPETKHIFDQWILGIRATPLKYLAQKSRLEMLEYINSHLDYFEIYFNDEVSVESINYRIATNETIPLDGLEASLNKKERPIYFSFSRDSKQIYLSSYR